VNMSAVLVDLVKQSTEGLPLDGAWLNQNRSLMQTLKSTVHKGLDCPKQRRSDLAIPNGAKSFRCKTSPSFTVRWWRISTSTLGASKTKLKEKGRDPCRRATPKSRCGLFVLH